MNVLHMATSRRSVDRLTQLGASLFLSQVSLKRGTHPLLQVGAIIRFLYPNFALGHAINLNVDDSKVISDF